MDRSEFKGCLIEWKSYIFFRLIVILMLSGLFIGAPTTKIRIELCLVCIGVFLIVLFYKSLFRFRAIVTKKEVQFLRFGKIYRSIDLTSNYLSACKYTSQLLFASLENHYVLLVNPFLCAEQNNHNSNVVHDEIHCRGLSKRNFEKFMTSVLWSSSNARTPGIELKISEANYFQQSFSFEKASYVSMKKHYNSIRNGFFCSALFTVAVVFFFIVLFLPAEFLLNLQISIMISGPFFLLAAISLLKIILFNIHLEKRVPSHIEFNGDSLQIDNHCFSLSSITSIKASPANCDFLNNKNIRTISISEGRKETCFWLGDCIVKSDHDMLFEEYGKVYNSLVIFLGIANKFPQFTA